jgi:hypothetical protein
MYIEQKIELTGPARIGRVTFSKSGKTIYCRGQIFQSLKGRGYKSNYFDMATGVRVLDIWMQEGRPGSALRRAGARRN